MAVAHPKKPGRPGSPSGLPDAKVWSKQLGAVQGLLSESAFVLLDSRHPYLQVHDWVIFAQEYLAAANLLDLHAPEQSTARLQVSGHSLECALKACLLSAGHPIPNSHNLISLCDSVENLGYHIKESQALAVFHLSLHYFKDLGTGTKFKTRYPISHQEFSRAPIPDHTLVKNLIESLCAKALENAPQLGA